MLLHLLPQPRFERLPLGNLCTRSKGLDHWTTSGALYFRDQGRALLHIAPPQASRLLSRGVLTYWWVSELLKRSVEESRQKHAVVRSGCSTVSCTVQYSESHSNLCRVCDVWISCRGHHFGGPRFEPSPLGNLCTGSKGLDHWTTSVALYFRDRGKL